jgi:hypothetical protein
MKSSIFLIPLLLVLLLPANAHAQISLGVEGGFTRAWEYYNVPLPEDAEIHVNGFNVHALAYVRLGKNLSVGIEPGFVQRGAACIPGFIGPFIGDSKFLLDYIEAPVMLKGNLPLLGGAFEAFGKVGYGASWMVSRILEIQPADIREEPWREELLDSRVRKIDHGAYGSLGIGYNLGPGQFYIESDYYFGVPDVDLMNRSENRSLSMNVGYVIEL